MKNRTYIDTLPIEIILKISSYLNEIEKLALLRNSTQLTIEFPSLKKNYSSYSSEGLFDNVHGFFLSKTNKMPFSVYGIFLGLLISAFYSPDNFIGIAAGTSLTFFSSTTLIIDLVNVKNEHQKLQTLYNKTF